MLCFFDDIASKPEDPMERAGADLGLKDWIGRMGSSAVLDRDGLEMGIATGNDGGGW